MSYRIFYENEKIVKSIREKKNSAPNYLRNVTIVIWALVAGLILWRNKAVVLDCLIPGDNTVTVAAFAELIENVKGGTGMSDSVAVFCKEILDHAQMPN